MFNFLKKRISKGTLSNEALFWNKFIFYIVNKEISSLSGITKYAALVFFYDCEVNNGGHSNFFDCYGNIEEKELIFALNIIGASDFAKIFQEALIEKDKDDFTISDEKFGKHEPELTKILFDFVVSHSDEIIICD